MGTMSFIQKLVEFVATPKATQLDGTTEATLSPLLVGSATGGAGMDYVCRGAHLVLHQGRTIRVRRNGPERQKKNRGVRGAAPVRHKLHAGQGPGLFRTLSDRCNEHCLRSASLLRRRSLWVNHRRMATAKPYEQHSRAGAEVFSVGSSDLRLAWVAGSFAFRP